MPGTYESWLSLAVVQTSLDKRVAWQGGVPMAYEEEERMVMEIRQAFRAMDAADERPLIAVLPELSLPRSFLHGFRRLCAETGILGIAGVDYKTIVTRKGPSAVNEAILTVPHDWPNKARIKNTNSLFVGKSDPAPFEKEELTKAGLGFKSHPDVWLFDAGPYGRLAVSICYDMMDVDRPPLYRTEIQHLLVIAYNQDIGSFYHIAESLCRTIFCNVVICNTGYYGGSLAVSPYYKPHMRTIYRHEGQGLFVYQIIKLPVEALIEAQGKETRSKGDPFKNRPPGFGKRKRPRAKRRSLT